jgi:hypothetical protein
MDTYATQNARGDKGIGSTTIKLTRGHTIKSHSKDPN